MAPACRHDICALGDKLGASTTYQRRLPSLRRPGLRAGSLSAATAAICSYYSTEPVWDAKCVAEVGAICGLTCSNPLPSPTTRQRTATPIALAGGRALSDPPRGRQPQRRRDHAALVAERAADARGRAGRRALRGRGAAANRAPGSTCCCSRATTPSSGDVEPDFTKPLASGPVPDLPSALRPPAGASGSSQVDVSPILATAVAAVPPPPAVVSPRRGAHDFQPVPQVSLTVLGGVRGGAVHARVQGTSTSTSCCRSTPTATSCRRRRAGGQLRRAHAAAVAADLRGRDLRIDQARSVRRERPVAWDVVVDAQAPASPAPPVMLAPRDPTSSPDPAENVFQVSGHGTPTPVQACDQGGVGAAGVIADSLHVAADGNISGSGDADVGHARSIPIRAGTSCRCHRMDARPPASRRSSASACVRPPSSFRARARRWTAARAACSRQLIARGTIPYSPSTFGPLIVAEELGRLALGLIPALVTVDPTPRSRRIVWIPGGDSRRAAAGLPFGKHLLYFFQAPPPPANATQAEIDAHYRAFASIATTPTSRIAVPLPPLPLRAGVGRIRCAR